MGRLRYWYVPFLIAGTITFGANYFLSNDLLIEKRFRKKNSECSKVVSETRSREKHYRYPVPSHLCIDPNSPGCIRKLILFKLFNQHLWQDLERSFKANRLEFIWPQTTVCHHGVKYWRVVIIITLEKLKIWSLSIYKSIKWVNRAVLLLWEVTKTSMTSHFIPTNIFIDPSFVPGTVLLFIKTDELGL